MASEAKRISALELRDFNEVDWNSKDLPTDTPFYHYTTIDAANNILNSNYMFASSIILTNDTNERERYEESDKNTYILCFCNSKTEKIPMWYLYSGISGKGIRLGLTPAKMRDLVKSISEIYPVENYNVLEGNKLTIHEDFELYTGWVYYSHYPSSEIIKYKNSIYSLTDSIIDFENDNDFIKNYEWNYEKEFRLVIKLKKASIFYPRVAIKINPYDFRIKLAPENCNKADLLNMNGFKKYLENKIEDSGLKISMNLIRRDFNWVLDYIRSTDDESIIEEIKKIVNERIKKGD